MQQVLSADVIRKHLANYLAGKMSLKAFHSWFVPATWDAADSAPAPVRELVYEISLRVGEYTSRHLTESDLRNRLAPLVLSIHTALLSGAEPFVRRVEKATGPNLFPRGVRVIRLHRVKATSRARPQAVPELVSSRRA